MKKILLLTLMLLTACSSPLSATPASFFNDQPVPVILTVDSTSEQIQRALLERASRWKTVQMDGMVTWYAPSWRP